MAKKFDDDEGGVSLLNKRLSGEKLDNKVIDELMEVDKVDKKTSTTKKAKKNVVVNEDPNITKNKDNIQSNEELIKQRNDYNSDVIQQVIDDNKVDDEEDEIINKVISNTYTIMREDKVDNESTNSSNNSVTQQPIIPINTQIVSTVNPNIANTPYPNNQAINGQTVVPVSPYPQVNEQPNIQQGYSVGYTPVPVGTTSPYQTQPVANTPQMSQEDRVYIEQVAQRRKRNNASKVAKKIVTKILVWALYIGIVAGFSWLIYTYVLGIVKMSGDSMSPTYYNKETLIVDKITVNLNKVSENDVIIFDKGKNQYIARVIATQGDKVTIDNDNNVYINNVLYTFQDEGDKNFFSEEEEEIIAEIPNIKTEYNLGVNEFFVYNDNKDMILDSRLEDIGIVTKNEIYGVVLVGFNFNK